MLKDNLKLKFFFAPEKDKEKEFHPSMYLKSDWRPPAHVVPANIQEQIQNIEWSVKLLFKKQRFKSNLLWHQKNTLKLLQQQNDYVIVFCDKNMGPAIIERERYIKLAFIDHLNDNSTYDNLTKEEAKKSSIQKVFCEVEKWVAK